jgi:hypothetical protein
MWRRRALSLTIASLVVLTDSINRRRQRQPQFGRNSQPLFAAAVHRYNLKSDDDLTFEGSPGVLVAPYARAAMAAGPDAQPQLPSGQCTFKLDPGYIIGSSSYKTLPGCGSAAACCSRCSADKACSAFTYEPSWHECFLKNNTEGRRGGSSGTVSGAPPPPPLAAPVVTLQYGPISHTGSHYKSWNIDASPNRQWDVRNLSDPQLHYLAGASEPGILRFGGSGNDGLHYGVGRPCPVSGRCLNESHFSRLMEFAQAAGSRIVFGVNIRTHDSQGNWDPSEFAALLDWAIGKGWGSVFWGFELGNGTYTTRLLLLCLPAICWQH